MTGGGTEDRWPRTIDRHSLAPPLSFARSSVCLMLRPLVSLPPPSPLSSSYLLLLLRGLRNLRRVAGAVGVHGEVVVWLEERLEREQVLGASGRKSEADDVPVPKNPNPLDLLAPNLLRFSDTSELPRVGNPSRGLYLGVPRHSFIPQTSATA